MKKIESSHTNETKLTIEVRFDEAFDSSLNFRCCLVLQLINPNVEIVMVENTPDDPRQRKPDITKAKELLGWEPKIKLRDGLPLMEEDFRARLQVPRKK